jgi:hypothetical protein
MTPTVRDRVRAVTEQPTLTAQGAQEVFNCQPSMYYWLLEHPDQAARLWKMLGAKVADIQDQGSGRFSWQDGQGSSLHWDLVHKSPTQRIWYAEGMVKPAMLLPASQVRAVVVLNLNEGQDSLGRPAMKHQVKFALRADGMAVALAARIMGASAPKAAEQYVGQIETFFAALAWYLDEHPRKAEVLMEKLHKGEDGR